MNCYKLESKEFDEKFLEGISLKCPAIIKYDDLLADSLNEGSPIVVILSNGKKYKGKVASFTYRIINGYAKGELEIVRIM